MSNISAEKLTGRVKWFNNKAGYGFVTVTDGPKSGSDVFVHHSSIKVDSEQYKYLVQGEYTEFTLSSVASDKHEFQAAEVCGIKGGKLMCETRNETRSLYKKDYENLEPVKQPRSVRAPVDTDNSPRANGEWTHVRPPVQTQGGRGQRESGRGPQRGRGQRESGGRGRGGRGPQ
jgi:cold shock CspA family protein